MTESRWSPGDGERGLREGLAVRRGLQRGRKELWKMMLLIVVLDFHKCIHMSKLIKLYILIMYSLVYVNYTSIKLSFKKEYHRVYTTTFREWASLCFP